MPNHVTNRVTIVSEDADKITADKIIAAMKTNESEFDFTVIIPEPEFNGTDGWYQWRIDNWGTKWNAYDISIEDNVVTFDTAWSHPEALMIGLSKTFPDATFKVVFADEDLGCNCGSLTYRNGKEFEVDVAPPYNSGGDPDESKVWTNYAMKVKGWSDEEIKEYWEEMEADEA